MDAGCAAPRRNRHAWLAYALAALLGLGLALWSFPLDFLFPEAGGPWMPVGDAAQHMIAQRYLIRDDWRWPPLLALNLNTPDGVNIAFADGIPLLALPLKALAGILPPGFHGIGLWYGIAVVLQPIAAVWCLRGAGERRVLPALAVALAAASMPAWLGRYGHAALTGHFLLLLALGMYLRLVRRQTPALWVGAAAVEVAALLTHPYLAAMALALLGAVPLTLMLRGDRAWRTAALGVGVVLGVVLLTMAGFGYLGAGGDGGYGQFAMNLLSPVWPYGSGLLPGLVSAEVDATGHGGWEGYNWLGFGLLLGLAAAAVLRGRALMAMVRRHAGLALALVGLTLLAVSHRVGLGDAILIDLGPPPAMLEQFRTSGRFFWPVAYALLLGSAVALARHPRPAVGLGLVLALGIAQFADAMPIRDALREWAATRRPWTLDAPALRTAFAEHDRLTLLPSWPCIRRGDDRTYEQVLETLAIASEGAIPVSTMYVARWRSPPRCDDDARAAAPLAPGELRLILPAAQDSARHLVPGGAEACRPLGEAVVACSGGAAREPR